MVLYCDRIPERIFEKFDFENGSSPLLTVPMRCFFYGSFTLFLSCFCYAFVCVCLLMPCGHLLGKGLSFVMSNCEVVTILLVSWVRCGKYFPGGQRVNGLDELFTGSNFMLIRSRG